MNHIKLSDLLREVYDHPALRPKHKAWHSGDITGTWYMGMRGLNDVDLDVEYTADIYHGSGAIDDPNDIDLRALELVKELKIEDVSNPTPEEQKVIQQLQAAAKAIMPSMANDVILPAGIDLLKLNQALKGWLDEDINNLTEKIYEKHQGDIPERGDY